MLINIIVSLFLYSSTGLSKDLINIVQTETAQTIPQGVWGFGLFQSFSNFTEQYDQGGNNTLLSTSLNKDFSFNDLILEEKSLSQQVLSTGAFQAFGIDSLDSIAGEHRGELEVRTKVQNFFLSYGLSKKLSLFAILPLIKTDITFKNRFKNSTRLNKVLKELEDDGQYSKVSEVQKKLKNPILWQLNEYGYKAFYPQSTTGFGDLRLMSRYGLFENNFYQTTLGLISVIPTGQKNDVNQFIDLYYSDNQYDLGVESLNEFKITPKLNLISTVSYTFQLPSKHKMRIPKKEDDIISPDIDNNTEVNFGDIFTFQLQSTHQLTSYLSTSIGYKYQSKRSDSFKGSRFEPKRYKYLEKDTNAMIQTVFASLTTDTIKAFLGKKFPIPLRLSLSYAHQFDGINSNKSDELAINIMSFYKKL